MSDPGLGAFQRPPGGAASEQPAADDPCSWLQIEQGWRVATSDGETLGSVAQVAGSKQDDIFDGLAVEVGSTVRYAPGEQVGMIQRGLVTLKLTAEQAASLPPYAEAPAQKALRPGPESLANRASRWFRRR